MDTLILLDLMKTYKFIFFNSEESEIIDLMEYFDDIQGSEYFKNINIYTQIRGTISGGYKQHYEHMIANF